MHAVDSETAIPVIPRFDPGLLMKRASAVRTANCPGKNEGHRTMAIAHLFHNPIQRNVDLMRPTPLARFDPSQRSSALTKNDPGVIG